MLVRALQTKGVFAVHCEISEQNITVGWLFLADSSLLGQVVRLINPDEPENGGHYSVKVKLPQILTPNLILTRL